MRRALVIMVGLALSAGACGDATTTTTADTVAPAPASVAPSAPAPTSVASQAATNDTSPWPASLGPAHQDWTVRIVERRPHDRAAFTQGLELTDAGLLESTGRRGSSSLRLLDPATGVVIDERPLDDSYFGEGLTVVDDAIIQLTWQAGVALRYDATTFEPLDAYAYSGEAWGICAGPTGLWMSDGTPELQHRDAETFALLGSVSVRRGGETIENLNELECVGEHVVANVWKSDEILVIEPESGNVVATIDARALADEIAPTDNQAVLNGIADAGDGTLLLTGKFWPTLFVVVVEPAV